MSVAAAHSDAGAFRIARGGRVDRSRAVTLSHDGQFLPGLGGDTVAATLLAPSGFSPAVSW